MGIMACKVILVGQYCTKIRDELEVILRKDAFLPDEFGIHSFKDLFDKRQHLVLVLLSNVLALTSQDGCLDDAIKNQKWFIEFLILYCLTR